MNAITLRDYQKAAVDKVMWAMQLAGNDIVTLPTGAGKSIVIAEVGHRYGGDVLILQPSKEILAQNRDKLSLYVPWWQIGTYSASFNSKNIRKFTFATIGSVYKTPELFRHFKLVLVDECHAINQKNEESMFAQFFAGMGTPKVVGFTATPYRNVPGAHALPNGASIRQMTLKLMVRMKPFFWSRMLYNINNAELVVAGYLSPLVYDDCSVIEHEQIPFNRSLSDFDLDVYEEKLKIHIPDVLARIRECERECRSVLVFCSSIGQAQMMSAATPGSRWVSGKTPARERDAIINGFKNGQVKTVFNMGVLTTGFDHPGLDCIVLVRPTKSLSLYYQMLGRGVRIATGKRHCLAVDFSGTVQKMGPIERIELVKERQAEFKNPVWELYAGGKRWHNRPLYRQVVQKRPAPVFGRPGYQFGGNR